MLIILKPQGWHQTEYPDGSLSVGNVFVSKSRTLWVQTTHRGQRLATPNPLPLWHTLHSC
jgi:hypothetical protein